MAKEDFCYTHYDGDEARDVSHMTRLERGCYFDVRVSQRKFGHLSLDQIKKILSKDFEECFPAVELVLKKDEEGKYFIEWLENSLQKSKKHSKHQKQNGEKGGRPKSEKFEKKAEKKPNHNPNVTQTGDFNNPNETQLKPNQKPLEDGDEDEDGNEDVSENENPGLEKFLIPEMLKIWKIKKPKYPVDRKKDLAALGGIAKFVSDQLTIPYNPRDGETVSKILSSWDFMAEFISKTPHINSYNLAQVEKYSQTIVQKIQNGESSINAKNNRGSPEVSTASAFSKIDSMPG